MKTNLRLAALCLLISAFICLPAWAQSSGTIEGVVKDATGGVVSGATVEIQNPVTRFDRSTSTDGAGVFRFANVPFNPYRVTVTAVGFAPYNQDVVVRSVVTTSVPVDLKVAGVTAAVEVT